LVIGSDGALTF